MDRGNSRLPQQFDSMVHAMQVEIAQIALVDGDVEHNTRTVTAAIARADVAGGTRLIVFPETTLSGFPTRANIAAVAQTVDGPALGAVRDAAARAGVAVAVGLAERKGPRYYNTSVLIDAGGAIVLRYRKTHLWGGEATVFAPGDRFATCAWNGITVGILICYDIEFPECARALAALGADLLIVTNGNMDPYGPVHRRAMTARAIENQVYALVANRCGQGKKNLRFPGESAIVDPCGDIIACANAQEIILRGQIDCARIADSRRAYHYLKDARVSLGLTRVENSDGSHALVIPDRAPSD